MNVEEKVINSLCRTKDISVLLSENVDALFVSHKDVWNGIKKYYYKYRAVPDIETLAEKFRDLNTEFSGTGETKYYLDELRDTFIKSKIRNLFLDKSQSLKEQSASEILEGLLPEIHALNKLTGNVRDVDLTNYEQAEEHFKAQAERSQLMGGTPGIPTGFAAIDSAYPTGMAGGHFIVVIGWPSRGKSWFAAHLACKAHEAGFKPMIVSLEMSPETMRDRIYTIMGSGLFANSDLVRGDINLDDFRSWGKRTFANKSGFIVVSNEGEGDVTPSTVQGKIDQHRPDLLILDYHQLFDDNKHSLGEVERNKNVSREFKKLAVMNNLPVVDITAATMKDVSDQESAPLLSQVAWSKAIEYDADIAMAVHKERNSNIIEVVSRKNRHGQDFAFALDWDINNGIIKELY